MKRVLRTTVMTMLVLVLCLGMLAPAARADQIKKIESDSLPITVTIPVKVNMVGSVLPEEDTVTASIKSLTSDSPDPASDYIDIVCEGDKGYGESSFSIQFDQLGVYSYKITVQPSDYYLVEPVNRDPAEFWVDVYVLNSESGDGYMIEYYASDNAGMQPKCDLVDQNEYLDPLTITASKKWVDQDSDRPSSVKFGLYLDGELVEDSEQTLSKSNDWQCAWKDLDPRLDWSVKEVKVPAGYTASYKTVKESDDSWIITVTNTGSLLQTGQLNWPIPVLTIAGLAVIALGVFLITRRKKENNA